ncbi:MAG: helix-turn-helix transcriptional regulator [Sedimentisphaerales bacterium]|nr:helix-turn-helix transcriptional regulator [Sedimentisphaerales bacterium]
MTLKQIGQLIGVSESFISRVANRQRNFTTKHLIDFEAALGRPVALLLLSTTPRNSIPQNMRRAYDMLVKLLENQSLQTNQE